ncbi:hypothetical protein NO2_1544 [Candidatus Termititenax persephonae]|uniref:Uncharacterized protein n=1 Tax=Candidatus Termititenax persephonae TaxID=2218525 RepID=A0A388TIN4_9BACT|nr:hypothetical protein NO2_1544 [Candidatus Termititenax persephonae]
MSSITSAQQFYAVSCGDFIINKNAQNPSEAKFYQQHQAADLDGNGVTYDDYLLFLQKNNQYQPSAHQIESAKSYAYLKYITFFGDAFFGEISPTSGAKYQDIPISFFTTYDSAG